MADDNKIIVSRIQHRRGLKQDLPQPLRAGEIGFAVDSRQVYIGGESNHPNSAQYDTVSFFENTLNAQEITQSIVDNQLIAFTVPGYKRSRGEFDGIRTSVDWTANTPRSIVSGAQSPSCVHTSAQVPVFAPSAGMFNMFKGNILNRGRFTSADVTVHKNGVKLIPEANAAVVSRPGPTADYAFDGTNIGGAEPRHALTLRTPPSSRDEVTLTYYGNAQIATTLEGLEGSNRAANSTEVLSFYADQQIPDFLKIPAENIRVSGVTGLGYFALDTRHITAFALSTQDITTPDNLGSTGNLLISREDSKFNATTVVITNRAALDQSSTITMEFDSGSSPEFESSLQIFTVPTTPTERKDFYRYDHLVIESDNPQNYIRSKLYPVDAEFTPQNSISKVEVAIPDITDAVVARTGEASNTEITGSTVGIAGGDLISVFFDGGNVVGNVISVSSSGFEIDQAIPESNVTYVNRGQGTVAGQFQVLIPGQAASLDVDQVGGNVRVFKPGVTEGTPTTFTRRSNEADTIFVAALPAAVDLESDPEQEKPLVVRPILGSPLGNIKIRPVLSVFLGTTNTLEEISSVVNENRQIEIPAAGVLPAPQNSAGSVQIFPAFGIQPGSTNRVFVTQRPGYSSVDVGGLEFQLHEDPNTPLLQRLNLVPRTYTRDDTVRAKLEVWLDKLLKDTSTNLFTQVLLGGEKYTSQPVSSLGAYNLVVDSVFGEIIFCDRTEASNFNFLVNNLYASSAFGQRDDTLGGVRGLVNLKNNIEIQTRESASAGEKVVSFQNMEVVRFPRTDSTLASNPKFTLDITQFNNFVIDYSIADLGTAAPEGDDRYQRTGTMYISAIPDDANSATISDVFTSYIKSEDSNQLEPKFGVSIKDGTTLEVNLLRQDPGDPNSAFYDIDTELNMRYVVRRWSSFN